MKNITKLNGFALFVMFLLGALAAVCTLFFGVYLGVRSVATILFRVVVSFLLFTAAGFFIAQFLEGELAVAMLSNAQKTPEKPLDVSTNKESDIDQAPNHQELTDTQQNTKNEDDKSFERIVVVNHDDDQ